MLLPSGFNAAFCIVCQQDEDRESLVKVKSKYSDIQPPYSRTTICDILTNQTYACLIQLQQLNNREEEKKKQRYKRNSKLRKIRKT